MAKKFDKHLAKENQHKKEEGITVLGKVTEVLGGDRFRVKLENDHEVIAHLSGDIRRHKIRVIGDDWVDVEVSPYDLTRGRIKYRYKDDPRKSNAQQFSRGPRK